MNKDFELQVIASPSVNLLKDLCLRTISSLTSVFLSVFFTRKQPISWDKSLHSLSTAYLPISRSAFPSALAEPGRAWLVYHGFLSNTWYLRGFSLAFSCFLFLLFRLVLWSPKSFEVLATDFTDFLLADLAFLRVISCPGR